MVRTPTPVQVLVKPVKFNGFKRITNLKNYLLVDRHMAFMITIFIRLLKNFWTLRVDAYSRWVFIEGWALSAVCLFCNKTINSNNKTRRGNNARFL